jgi:hypothetical protein
VRISRLDRLALLVVVVSLGILVAGAAGTDAAFVVATGNPANTFSTISDWKPPVTSRATVVKSQGGIPGYVRAGGSYTVVASVTDDPSSNPPAGLGAVRSDVSTLTAGATALALPVAASTVGGQTYTHRSASSTVPAGKAAGSYTGTVTATDSATPANTSAAFAFPVVVDNTAPTRTSAIIANGNVAGRIDAGDTITFLWSEIIDPESVLPGWNGSATDVTVQVVNKQGNTGDTVTVRNAANTADLTLGDITMRIRDYVSTTTLFGGPTNTTRSRMAWNPSTGAVVVTLGPADTPATVTQSGTQTSNYQWAPVVVFDRAGNLSDTTTYTEPGAANRDW